MKKFFAKRGLWYILSLLGLFLSIISFVLYLLTGVTQFDTSYSTLTIVAFVLAIFFGLLGVVGKSRFVIFVQYTFVLMSLFAYITSQVNMLANILYNVDGSTLPVSFIVCTILTILSTASTLVSSIISKDKVDIFFDIRKEDEAVNKDYKPTILFSNKFWSTLTLVFSSLLAVVIVASSVLNNYATLINQNLHITTSEIVGAEDESKIYFHQDYTSEDDVKNYAEDVCERVEGEGLVLLENKNNALPLSADSKVSLFGTGSIYLNCSGQGMRTASDKDDYINFKDSLKNIGVEVNPILWDFYNNKSEYGGYKKYDSVTGLQTYYINEVPWSAYDASVTSSFKNYSDSAIVVLTRDSTEGSDVSAYGSDGKDGNYLALSNEERELLVQLTALKNSGTFKNIVVIINSCLQFQMDFLDDDSISVDSLLYVGNLGMSGINAVSKALVGKIIPSGKLSDTLLKNNFASPAMASWTLNQYRTFANSFTDERLDTTQQYYGAYIEDIYVGYRYFETRYTDYVTNRDNVGEYSYNDTVAFPFGSGISYTDFEYSDYTVTKNADKTYTLSVNVRNTGTEYSGKETVEFYLQKPYTSYAIKNGIEVASAELVGFAKTNELAPGKDETVKVTVSEEDFTSYDVYGAGTYILDSGDYYLTAAKDSHAACNNILSYRNYSINNGMTEEGDKNLVEKVTISEQDLTTYSVSKETGKEITNHLGFADINRNTALGGNFITYVSRNDWEGTWPTNQFRLELTDDMVDALQSDILPGDSDEEMPTMGASVKYTLAMLRGLSYDDEKYEDLLDQLTFDEMNTLLTTDYCNVPAVASVIKPKTDGQDGPTYCKEGITGSRFPSENVWSSTFNTELIAEVGKAMANDSLLNGYEDMWIPGINIHRTPYGGRAHEYFSEDPYLTGIAAEAEIKALQDHGVLAYPKHYAFNDEECNRNGIQIWLEEQSARQIYLKPWIYAVSPSHGNAHALMSSFNRVGLKWSSANYALMTTILRDEMGFDGFVITDMADSNAASYMSCVDGIVAGTDCWFSSGKSHSFAAYENNPTVVNAMRQACHRILYATCNYSFAMNGISDNAEIIFYTPWWKTLITTVLAALAVLTAGAVGMLVVSKVKEPK